jgi:hypothetical protein
MPLVDLRVRHLCALLLGCWAAKKLPLRLHPEDRDNQEKKETYMSKKLTLKGLALGAVLALGVSAFAGAPAQAATPTATAKILTSAKLGTTLNTLQGTSFALKTNLDPTLVTLDGKKLATLTYLITNPSGVGVKLASVGASVGANGDFKLGSADAAADVVSTDASNESGTSAYKTNKVLTVLNTAGTAKNTSDSSDIGSNLLVLTTSTDAKDAYDITVQAFLDTNGDMKISDFEYVGAAVPVHFIPVASASVTTTLKSAVYGASTIQGKIVIGGDVNMQNLGTQVKLGFTKNGATQFLKVGQTSYDTVDASYDSSEAGLLNAVQALASTDSTSETITTAVYAAQAYLNAAKLGAASGTTSTVLGTEASVDGTDILKVTGSASTSNSADTNDFKGSNSGNASASTAKIKTGYAGNITFTSKLLSKDGTDVKLSGQTVKVTLTKSVLASASTFVAGGVTLTATSGAVSFTTTTDASGVISFTGAGTGAKDDSVAVKIEVLGKTGYKAADVNTITWVDAAFTKVVSTDLAGASAQRKIEKGASYTLSYKLVDQFGQVFTTGTYRATITASAVSGSTNVAITQYATAVAGVITAAIVDNSTGAGVYSIDAALYKYDSAAASWGSALAGDLDPAAQTVNVNSVVAATVSGTASSTVAVATITKTLVNADLRVDNNTTSAPAIGYGATATQTISGAVSDATGARVPGAVVTVAGAGLGFVVNGNVYSIGSATINTDVNGAYSVDVYSTTAGKASVVVTSGAATKTVAIEFSGVTTTINTNVISLDVISLSQVGRAITATVKIVDKFGNPVKGITPVVSVTGVGSVTTAAATDATGITTVQFLAGANDFGDAVITAKYTGVDAAGADAVVSVSKTVTVGVTDAQVDIVNNRVTAVSSFTKGRTVSFYVDGVKKWSKLSASDADVVLNYNLKKGTHTVTVKISGGFVTTEKFIVK